MTVVCVESGRERIQNPTFVQRTFIPNFLRTIRLIYSRLVFEISTVRFTDQVFLFFVGELGQTLYVQHLFTVCFLIGCHDGFRKFAIYQRLNEHSYLQKIDELLHTVRFHRTRCSTRLHCNRSRWPRLFGVRHRPDQTVRILSCLQI